MTVGQMVQCNVVSKGVRSKEMSHFFDGQLMAGFKVPINFYESVIGR